MASITFSEVERLARLARLDLTEDQVQRFTRQLADILEFARQVDAVDASAIDAADLTSSGDDRLRDDAVQPCLSRDEALGAAPDADPQDGLFKVPRVLNG